MAGIFLLAGGLKDFNTGKAEMRIIDFRCRPPFGNFKKDWIFNLEDTPQSEGLVSKYAKMDVKLPKSLLNLSMDDFFEECDKNGIYLNIVPLRRLPFLGNDDLDALLRKWPDRFMGFAGLQPGRESIENCLAEIGKYVIDGLCKGIYLEPGLDDPAWEIDDKRFFPVYEKCENLAIPVIILFGGVFHKQRPPSYEIYNPVRVENLCRSFPELKILLSHAGWPYAAQTCAVALNYKNIWLSPDGFMINHPASQDYVAAANYRLRDRMVFGSLYPALSAEHAIREYKKLLRGEVWEQVFYKNGQKFLGLR